MMTTESPQVRVGIVGADSAHVDHFLRYFNVEQRAPGWRVVAVVVGGSDERVSQLTQEYGLAPFSDPGTLIGHIDAALICDRDGRNHADQAGPLLTAGVDVFIAKPVATSMEDMDAMLRAARSGGAVLVGGSAFRHAPEVREAVGRASKEAPQFIHVMGPADPTSPYAGLHFYGSHHVELLLELLGNPEVDQRTRVQLASTASSHVAVGTLANCDFALGFIDPDRQSTFRASVSFGAEVINIETGPTAPLYVGQMDELVRARRDRRPAGDAGLIGPIQLLEKVVRQLP